VFKYNFWTTIFSKFIILKLIWGILIRAYIIKNILSRNSCDKIFFYSLGFYNALKSVDNI
jgi:hypothetical protein